MQQSQLAFNQRLFVYSSMGARDNKQGNVQYPFIPFTVLDYPKVRFFW